MKRFCRWLALALSLTMLLSAVGMAKGADAPELEEVVVLDGPGTDAPGADDIGAEGLVLEGPAADGAPADAGALPDLSPDLDLEGGMPDPETPRAAVQGEANATGSAWSALQERISNAEYRDIIKLEGDVRAVEGDAPLYIPAEKSLTIDLAGWTLDRGLLAPTVHGMALYVMGDLTLWDTWGTGRITGAYNSYSGGGIYVGKGGRLTMQGGTICNNHAKDGAGIWADGGTICLQSGAVRDNTADEVGGGVLVTGSGDSVSFELYGTEISANAARDGGGVCVIQAGMKGVAGKITGNDAQHGGGIFIFDGVYCTLGNVEVSGNVAEKEGGGVYVKGSEDGSTLECGVSTSIAQNHAASGGGIMCNGGKIIIKGGVVSGNVAETGHGGGVLLFQSRMEMDNGSIEDNSASKGVGGGVYIGQDSTLSGREFYIRGNQAESAGGVGIYNGSRFEMQSGSVNGNTARFAGGVGVSSEACFRMEGGSIRDNVATDGDGGGVFSWEGAVFEMSGGAVMGNSVPAGRVGGGGFFPGTLRVSGNAGIVGNYSGTENSNCYLGYQSDGSHRIIVTGQLYADAGIYVDYPWKGGAYAYPITDGLGYGGYLGAFKCSDYDYIVRWNGDGTEAEIVPLNAPQPTARPTVQPTARPTVKPTAKPTVKPTAKPTEAAKVKLAKCKAAAIKDRTYTGKAIKPGVKLTYGGKTLAAGRDYDIVGYSANTSVGLAKVKLKGRGRFTGTRSLSFRILPRAVKIAKLTAGKGSVTASWGKRSEAGGYKLQYALKSSFAGAKSLKVNKSGTKKATVKGLKAGRVYYFRIRSFKKVGGKVYQSAWSKAKKVKVK